MTINQEFKDDVSKLKFPKLRVAGSNPVYRSTENQVVTDY